MTIVTHATPYLLGSITLYALTAYLFRQELLDQLKIIRVRLHRKNAR